MSYRREFDYSIRTKEGKWLRSDVFREEAIKFSRNKYYCADPSGSPAWLDYWTEQLRRCDEGYEVGGWKITGHHYAYLNFTEIQVVIQVEGSNVSRKIDKVPDFWDGDFDYYWCIEIAKNGVANADSVLTNAEQKEIISKLSPEDKKKALVEIVQDLKMRVVPHPDYLEGGNHMIVGKSRRKGYSYKNAAVCSNTYNTRRKALTLIGAFDKKFLYPKGTMGMASNYLSHLNKYTAWGKAREYVDKQEHRKASFAETIGGVKVEAGYQSEIIALTFADNPDAARGKDALYVLFEEAGAFPNLKASYNATKPGLTAGKYITGQILIFGTGGDMESGTIDFAEMFYNPIQFGLMPFVNIWDENAENSYCGFFHPVYMNMEGYYDEQGNSDIEAATNHEKAVREKLRKNSTSSNVIQTRVQEYPLCPSEAFLTVSVNDFPIVELRARYNKVIANSLHIKLGQPVHLTREVVEENVVDATGNITKRKVSKVKATPDLDDIIQPIWDYKLKTNDLKGGVVIYEYPISKPPKGLYKIGFDPYRQQNSNASQPSLASIYVYKGTQKFSFTRNTIVAQYVGRPYSPDDVNRIAEMLAELYNTEVMYENEVTHVKSYFERKKKLHLLAAQPDAVISAAIKGSTVDRIYGIHMVEKLKDAGEKYIKEWLLTVRDFDDGGEPILNLDTINDPALLDELILYNRKGNFDRVMSFMMVMFQCAEEEEGKVYDEVKVNQNAEDLKNLIKRQFSKNNRN